MKKIAIAIDGPAGAGKSTVAKVLANRLNYLYIDTGAMYRAFTWLVLNKRIDLSKAEQVQCLLDTISLRLIPQKEFCRVLVNEQDITTAIRQPEVAALVSQVAAIGIVRKKMVQLQRQMAEVGGVILDGRDIGTVVLPKAELKVFLTALPAERARRRWRELVDQNPTITFGEVKSNIMKRDKLDSERELSPLRPAADAVYLDNSLLTFDETIEQIIALIEERCK